VSVEPTKDERLVFESRRGGWLPASRKDIEDLQRSLIATQDSLEQHQRQMELMLKAQGDRQAKLLDLQFEKLNSLRESILSETKRELHDQSHALSVNLKQVVDSLSAVRVESSDARSTIAEMGEKFVVAESALKAEMQELKASLQDSSANLNTTVANSLRDNLQQVVQVMTGISQKQVQLAEHLKEVESATNKFESSVSHSSLQLKSEINGTLSENLQQVVQAIAKLTERQVVLGESVLGLESATIEFRSSVDGSTRQLRADVTGTLSDNLQQVVQAIANVNESQSNLAASVRGLEVLSSGLKDTLVQRMNADDAVQLAAKPIGQQSAIANESFDDFLKKIDLLESSLRTDFKENLYQVVELLGRSDNTLKSLTLNIDDQKLSSREDTNQIVAVLSQALIKLQDLPSHQTSITTSQDNHLVQDALSQIVTTLIQFRGAFDLYQAQSLEARRWRDFLDRGLEGTASKGYSFSQKAYPIRSLEPDLPIVDFDEQLKQLKAAAPKNYNHFIKAFNLAADGYATRGPNTFAVTEHPHVPFFRAMVNIHACGNVLDVGCGQLVVPAYLRDIPVERLAVCDPLDSFGPRPFPSVKTFAEFLPWSDETFDTVIVGTSLDHFYLLDVALAEIQRVLKPEGLLLLWTGIFPQTTPYDPYTKTLVPIDDFHLFHPGENWLHDVLAERFVELERFDSIPSNANIAYRVKK